MDEPAEPVVPVVEQGRIKVVMVEDHPMTSAGLELFLSVYPDVELIGQVSSGEEALKVCERIQPDVMLMDVHLPGIDGIATTREIKRRYSRVQVIVLSSFQDTDTVHRAVQAGACGYLSKASTAHDLIYAIRAAHKGRSVFSQEATSALVQSMHKESGWGDLTEREWSVMDLLAEGLTNLQIANRMTVSVATAKFHVGSVLSKLGVSHRSEAITLYWQRQAPNQSRRSRIR